MVTSVECIQLVPSAGKQATSGNQQRNWRLVVSEGKRIIRMGFTPNWLTEQPVSSKLTNYVARVFFSLKLGITKRKTRAQTTALKVNRTPPFLLTYRLMPGLCNL